MEKKKFEVRAEVNMTLDFEVMAEDEHDARWRVQDYLPYVNGGKIEKQRIRLIRLKPKDRLTHCFVMDCVVDDVNEVE